MMPVKEESTPLADPSAPHTHINAAEFRCEGFPRPLTQADIDALHKRALDAEDHLRREVASNQALIAEVEMLNTGIKQAEENEHLADDAAEIIKARDQTIADLQALLAKCVPPGYSVGNAESGDNYLVIRRGDAYGTTPLFGGAAWAWNADWSVDFESCGEATTRDEAVAASWSHYHANPDRED